MWAWALTGICIWYMWQNPPLYLWSQVHKAATMFIPCVSNMHHYLSCGTFIFSINTCITFLHPIKCKKLFFFFFFMMLLSNTVSYMSRVFKNLVIDRIFWKLSDIRLIWTSGKSFIITVCIIWECMYSNVYIWSVKVITPSAGEFLYFAYSKILI